MGRFPGSGKERYTYRAVMLLLNNRLIKLRIGMVATFRNKTMALVAVAVLSGCSILPEAGPQPLERALPSPGTGKTAELAAKITETFGEGQSGSGKLANRRLAGYW